MTTALRYARPRARVSLRVWLPSGSLLLLLVALIGLVGMPYVVLMPIFAGDILHGDGATYGFLLGSSGVGALAGSLYLASRRTVLGRDAAIAAMSGLFGIGLFAFSFSRSCRFRWPCWSSWDLPSSCSWRPATRFCKQLSTTARPRDGLYDSAFLGSLPWEVCAGSHRLDDRRSRDTLHLGSLLSSGRNCLRPAIRGLRVKTFIRRFTLGWVSSRQWRPACNRRPSKRFRRKRVDESEQVEAAPHGGILSRSCISATAAS